MKVKIGPYRTDLIPVTRWERKYERLRSNTLYHEEADYKWFDKIIYSTLNGLEFVFHPLNRWSNSRKRKIHIHVDEYDVWSADHTLAMIIHPVLLKLKEVKHGYPCVDDEDVPEELRTEGAVVYVHNENPESLKKAEELDKKVEAKWEYVLGEMIWTFEQCKKGDRGDSQFYHNSDQLELITTPLESGGGSSVSFNYQKDPAKPKYWVDREAKKLHYDRINNGLRLFAKYYFALWD